MTAITDVRDALAELLASGLGVKNYLGRVPSPLQPNTVFVIPQPGTDFLTYENGTFCRATLALSAVIVGGTNNVSDAARWIDEEIERAPDATNANPTLGGLCSGLMLDTVSEPGVLDLQGGAFLSAELRFRPFFLTA